MRPAALVAIFLWATAVRADNVDLSTVPDRETVQLTIYNSEDLTLVRETRKVSFKRGVKPLQFSWAGTLIDPTSVELRFLTDSEQLDVIDTTFPHDKPQMLYWNVESRFDGEAAIEITYFTSGITWTAGYLAIANQAETELGLEGFVRVFNHSGEAYENAQVRLVVGTINLVEKIAQLAQLSVRELAEMPLGERDSLKKRAAKDTFFRYGLESDEKADKGKEKQIVKEGLSEYFIYTIEGTETVPDGWSKRMRNYTSRPIDVEIRRVFGGHAVFRSRLPAKNHDYQTVEYTASVKPGAKAERAYELIVHQGRNAKQNRVTLEVADVKRQTAMASLF